MNTPIELSAEATAPNSIQLTIVPKARKEITEEEIRFLAGEQKRNGRYRGRRVELNAFTSDQFVAWLEAKLRAHGVEKVVPDTQTLEAAYRRALVHEELNLRMRQALPEAERASRAVQIPHDLDRRVRQKLIDKPELPWDDALREVLQAALGENIQE